VKNEQEKMIKEMNKCRMKEKLMKARSRCLEIKKLIMKEPINPRKEKRLLKNRASAQKSRERKALELEGLRQENEQLRKINIETETKLSEVTTELNLMKKTVNLLSSDSHEEFNRTRDSLEFIADNESQYNRPSNFRSSILLAGALFGCLCVIGCISPLIIENNKNAFDVEPQIRLLESSASMFNDYYQVICDSIDRFQ